MDSPADRGPLLYIRANAELHPFLLQNMQLFLALCACDGLQQNAWCGEVICQPLLQAVQVCIKTHL